MALTPEQIAKLRGEAGLSPTPPKSGVDASSILAQRKAALGIVEQEPTLGEEISSDIKKRGEGVYGAITGTSPESQGENALVRGTQATAQAFGAIGDVGMDTAAKLVPQSVKDRFQQQSESGSDNPMRKAVSGGYSELMDKVGIGLDDLIQRFPQIGSMVESALKTAGASGEIANNVLAADAAVKAPGQIKKVVNDVKTAVTTPTSGKVVEQTGDDLTRISEKITPKPTVKEARLAMEQGRLVEGSEGGFLKEGTPRKVAASEQQARSARTIQKYIKDAANLDEPTLYTELKNNVSELSTQLKPELKKVKIKPEVVEKINTDWKAVKESQKGPFAPSSIVKPAQAHFEEVIKSIKGGTMDDIWEAAKKYDQSVPDRVKNATELSDSVLQTQKDIWLDNRRILRDAIKSSENGVGETARQAFAEMTDMYEAQNGLLSKAKINTTPDPSKLEKFFDSKTGKVLKYGAAVTGVAGTTKAILD